MRVRTHTNPFHFYQRLPKIDFKQIFFNYNNQLDLEIGFGRGKFLFDYAKKNPQRNLIGVEIRKAIVQIAQKELLQQELNNILLIHSNAQIVLEDIIEDESLRNIFIFHPDPWFKKSHHKRRVINKKFLDCCKQKLSNSGKIYLSTDVEELWNYLQEQFQAYPEFQKIEDPIFWETYYKTNWQLYCQKENRQIFLGVYELRR